MLREFRPADRAARSQNVLKPRLIRLRAADVGPTAVPLSLGIAAVEILVGHDCAPAVFQPTDPTDLILRAAAGGSRRRRAGRPISTVGGP